MPISMQISATAFMLNHSVNCLAAKNFKKPSGIFPGVLVPPPPHFTFP